jgi:hypothetical protein
LEYKKEVEIKYTDILQINQDDDVVVVVVWMEVLLTTNLVVVAVELIETTQTGIEQVNTCEYLR